MQEGREGMKVRQRLGILFFFFLFQISAEDYVTAMEMITNDFRFRSIINLLLAFFGCLMESAIVKSLITQV